MTVSLSYTRPANSFNDSNANQVNLNESLESALLMAQSELQSTINVVTKFGDIPTITCMPTEVKQALLHLLRNASQAIEDKGTVTVSTNHKHDQVEVVIQDSGKGIPEHALPMIFAPQQKSTVSGLNHVCQTVEQHGGSIKLDTKVGKGSRFAIALPTGNPEMALAS